MSVDLALVVATLLRPHAIQRLINSVRTYFPDMPIYVADQSHPSPAMRDFYSSRNCSVVWMDHDSGVCASRNAAVELVKEPFFILCDDDFFFDTGTRFDAALTIFHARPDVGVVGGCLYDHHETSTDVTKNTRYWELLFSYDQEKGKLCAIPVHYFAPEPAYIQGVRYYECDAVMNFAVFRTEMFDSVIRWDPRFKSNGEHEDFYLNLKMNGRYRVVYTPDIIAHHHHPHQPNYWKFRFRSIGWQKFLDKWKLRQYLELDVGLRVTNQVDQVLPYASGYENHYNGSPLDTREAPVRTNQLLISNVTGRLIPQRHRIATGNNVALACTVQFDLDGRGKTKGGAWHYETSRPSTRRDPVFEKPCPGERVLEFNSIFPDFHTEISDIFCFIRPSLPGEGAARFCKLEGFELYFSVAIGSDYVVYMKKSLIHEQHVICNQWNAVSVSIPPLSCDLVIELAVFHGAKLVYSTSSVVPYSNQGSVVRADQLLAISA